MPNIAIASIPPLRSDDPPPARPLRVHVLVDLAWRPEAGGHVKCWEAFARAALETPDAVDLTVHFTTDPKGDRDASPPREHSLGGNVRYRLHRQVFSTARLPFLSHAPDHTDLAPYHPGLARALAGADVIHTTDAFFNFAQTARRVARRRRVPLVNSIHTDTPAYTRRYTAETVRRLFGSGRIHRFLIETLKVDQRGEHNMRRKLAAHQAGSAFALLAREEDRPAALTVLPPERIGFLGRGIDKTRFHPDKRDRAWLQSAYAVPPEAVVVLFVGRVDLGKRAMVLAEAVERLIAEDLPVWLFCAGDGADRRRIAAMLGPRAVCPGFLPPGDIPRLQAGADLFAMPSEIETFGNAAAEALAAGLPVLASAKGGVGRLLRIGESGLVVEGGALEWADALRPLITDAPARARMSAAARRTAAEDLPSWLDVLQRDLLPVWRAAATRRPAKPSTVQPSTVEP